MKKVFIAFFSHSGETEKIAEYIAEGIRFTGNESITMNISDIHSDTIIKGYDGYIFGSPTYSLNLPEPMKLFLSKLEITDFKGKLGGAFGAYTHDVGYEPGGLAAAIIFDFIQKELKMEPFELVPLKLREDLLESNEGIRACQVYGKVFGERLG